MSQFSLDANPLMVSGLAMGLALVFLVDAYVSVRKVKRVDAVSYTPLDVYKRQVTGKPIKIISSGEKPDSLEEFHPDRMAKRILGTVSYTHLDVYKRQVRNCARHARRPSFM